ncbi:hypothetical protein A2X44_01190 [candidate division CPR3 bacterium GWF2_35_18]|uniref:Sugar transferase, probable phospho-glucosyltransferase n=1 Tax=candidate division CPR3 bacterium GW2011_GWF2_35_18 TaxID=1618350 RepID=A0A0G0BLK3_UNCC3|nr:MAG: Sugar transferase, probable phospho-glucosyltransferase [candidate division CPR3 bacterium GW2011_GWF2_35_18]KKP86450.1 MAG: Sugar transferase, probable phospho-glucosyltransferase [candidate division CPR3 bacterium GW2011_GWE2_35_7]OGB63517.1 MAG: hypothetical protein A2X44_01190 [candidate division CPR3 bacterium GWF2_35_18]OGB64626.1 MAG: hypothetical protein A2250_03740 [candidate division CPR3 bacterium RIFOXYA2_FULL_35_13]OGB76055.1 MAG: hypothetical protein A2476_00635 [candidate
MVSITILLVILPVLFIVAILIYVSSPGPVIFVQKRVGKNGKIFNFYKFRSMVLNAEKILYQNKKLLAEYKKNSYKIFDDPRVTKIGRFIRKTSLDEFPQFVNVLKGEMSVVGPRAYKPDELEEQLRKYPEAEHYVQDLLKVKPGITGPWQVSGRSEINFDQRVRMDAYYANRRSILYDLVMIIKTPMAVLKGRGAV